MGPVLSPRVPVPRFVFPLEFEAPKKRVEGAWTEAVPVPRQLFHQAHTEHGSMGRVVEDIQDCLRRGRTV